MSASLKDLEIVPVSRVCVTLYWTVMNMIANFAVTCNKNIIKLIHTSRHKHIAKVLHKFTSPRSNTFSRSGSKCSDIRRESDWCKHLQISVWYSFSTSCLLAEVDNTINRTPFCPYESQIMLSLFHLAHLVLFNKYIKITPVLLQVIQWRDFIKSALWFVF